MVDTITHTFASSDYLPQFLDLPLNFDILVVLDHELLVGFAELLHLLNNDAELLVVFFFDGLDVSLVEYLLSLNFFVFDLKLVSHSLLNGFLLPFYFEKLGFAHFFSLVFDLLEFSMFSFQMFLMSPFQSLHFLLVESFFFL